ncbi:MAG TPA: hypothetical protein VHF00_02795 [Acidimicrobiales bacterium]|nr:hypothetical protein [Acidimicrobiales bacterium]
MTRRRRGMALAGALAATTLATAAPAGAHGLGGRSDLPLPVWMFAYGAAGALVVSFAALAVLWPTARLEGGRIGVLVPPASPRATDVMAAVGRVVGVAVFAVVLAAALFGEPDATANIAPVAVYVVFWVGMILLSALVGDVWRVLNPFDTLGAAVERLRGPKEAVGDEDEDEESPAVDRGYWPAAVGLFAFVWLEIVYPDRAEPRMLGLAIAVYTIVVLAVVARRGRDWLGRGEAFTAFFGVIAHMAPLYADDEGRLRLRPPLVGLATLERRPGLEALVLVGLGSTTFDGISRTRFWTDLTDGFGKWPLTVVSTLGLVWGVGLVAIAYFGAMRAMGARQDRDPDELAGAFVHSLVPIAVAYAVAHYFSLLVFEGQTALALASDPFGRGWDLFGTARWTVDYRAVSTTTIAYVQAAAIVAGHVAGVVLAHDRAIALFGKEQASRSQYPLLAAMVAFTVGGLALLLGT